MHEFSVLIIRSGALGDLVYATSVIDALKAQYGESTRIDFVSTPGIAKLFEKDDRVNRIFPLKHKKVPLWLSGDKKRVVSFSKENPYDLLINFESGRQFESLVQKIIAKRKIGYFCSQIHFPKSAVHMVEIIKHIFKEAISQQIFESAYPRLIGSSSEEIGIKYNLPSDYVVVSPSNSHQKRNRINYRAWPNDHWRSFIARLAEKAPVVIIGNRGEEEFFEKLRPFPSNTIDLVGKTPLCDLIGIIEGAKALIATDTGTAHIASAVNTEVFALIGPTPAEVTGPYQTPHNRVHIVTANLECSPCYKTPVMKACKENICMKQITPQMLYISLLSAKIV